MNESKHYSVKNRKVVAYLSPDLHTELLELATSRGHESVSATIRRILVEKIRKERLKNQLMAEHSRSL